MLASSTWTSIQAVSGHKSLADWTFSCISDKLWSIIRDKTLVFLLFWGLISTWSVIVLLVSRVAWDSLALLLLALFEIFPCPTLLVLQQEVKWEHNSSFPAESDLAASGKHSDIIEQAQQVLMSSCKQHEVWHGNVCRYQIASVCLHRKDRLFGAPWCRKRHFWLSV